MSVWLDVEISEFNCKSSGCELYEDHSRAQSAFWLTW